MDIYFIRHGETDYNREFRLQGVTDIPLNANGIDLAEKTAEGMKEIAFDKIYSSPLTRAYQTAEIIRGQRKIEIIKTDGLKEISFGKYEGLICRGEKRNIPDPDFLNFFEKPQLYRTPPEGESLEHLIQRTSSFVRSVMENPMDQGKIILMASHGAAIRGILSGLLHLPIREFWSGPVHQNCGVTKLHVENGKFKIVFENKVYYKQP